ncbi:MAG TPA: DAK2 domain-containing protein [Bacilli bacterium]|nr:DAK2 domain-containing protein [Bacilli bacterium]
MHIRILDGQLYKAIVTNGAANLKKNYKTVDSLNVFPVPDGDTGTNMKMTIEAGANEIKDFDDNSIYEMSKKLSRGMLMGARGNSGVILSQLFRGIYKGVEGHNEVDVFILADAMLSGVRQAYKAVIKPVEGTILTVAREAAEKAKSVLTEDTTINDYFDIYLKEARESLERTPSLLPVLKEAGVIDSGGAGLIYIIEGMQMALEGKFISSDTIAESLHVASKLSFDSNVEVEFGYCTEFILQLTNKKVDVATFNEKIIVDRLSTLGDSIVVVKDDDIVKVHVHTLTPGDALNMCQQFGEFVTLKIENMTVQHSEIQAEAGNCACEDCIAEKVEQPRKKYAIVAVASGEGIVETFKQMGVDYVVSGGQSMNPSTDDFVKGFDALNADNIIVFPNNSNIIMAARQAGKYYKNASVHVVETKSIAQGYSALTMLDLNGEIEDIMAEISDVIANVTSGLVTYSVRDTEFEGLKIHNGDFIGIVNGKIVVSVKNRKDVIKSILEKAKANDKEIITIIYGADVNKDELEEVTSFIEENYSDLEIDTIEGKQDVYSYILSIE